ncbi:MAG: flagellar basal body L-ring protein FlgH [Myxococcales bacterium]|nr:flagellar basal body L-ring protein FlgH [Myxococcales bacterium]
MTKLLPLLLALVSIACGPKHIAKYEPRKRVYDVPEASAAPGSEQAEGSLFHAGDRANMLFTDMRALRVHDLVVVKVEELADAQRQADTDLRRRSKMSTDMSAFIQAAGQPQASVGAGAAGGIESDFQGLGSTRRTERLVATVPALVRKVLPNGNLFVEGHRVVLVNQEEHHFYISGVVRPIDIDQQNSVKSSLLADAEVEFTATGNLTDNQRQGWLSRFINWAFPF